MHEKRQKHPCSSSLRYDQIEIGREIKIDETSPLLNSLPNLLETMDAWIIGMIKSVQKNVKKSSSIVADHVKIPSVSPITANKAK